MNLLLKPVALALLVATSQATAPAYAQSPVTSTATPIPAATSPATPPIAPKAPEGWILYDSITYTPVVDDVSRHLDAARKAIGTKDDRTAAAELRAAAAELREHAARAEDEIRSDAKEDRARLADDTRLERDASRRLSAAADKISLIAARLEVGRITTQTSFDKAIDKAARADIEHRWLVTDVATWYPVTGEEQRHFTDATAAFAARDYKAAAADIRKAVSYLRLEASRATGAAKQDLDASVASLDRLAISIEKGTVKEEHALAADFARAEHALALAHRANAMDSWARKRYDEAGYELKAAAQDLESAAGWIGGEVSAGASAASADARALGDRLASGATWTRDEMAKAFESLGNGIDAVGHRVGDSRKASPAHVGT